jgi:hypothetical protein
MKKLGLAVILIPIIFLMFFRPVNTSRENSVKVKGKLTKIYDAGNFDISFTLDNKKQRYYINRGIESGLDVENLKEKLLNKNVTIHYAEHWTLLAPGGLESMHMTQLKLNDSIIYTEFQK